MENTNEKAQAMTNEDDVILPDGWTGDGDFFEWASGGKTDESNSLAAAFGLENGTEESESAPATGEEEEETAEPQTDEGDQPATQEEPEEQSTTIRFDANINHRKKSVEIDQSELPELYEKAYAADKFRKKLNDKNAELEEAEVVSQLLGYASVKEMLAAAKKSYEDSEVERLVSEKVHPDIAKDTVSRKMKEIEDKATKNRKPAVEEEKEEETPTKAGSRDFKPEVAELLKDFPELHGKTLPQEVVNDALSGKPLSIAYRQYVQKQLKAENAKLQKENETLKQNAEAAKRAPVRGVTKGSATNEGPDDPFLRGFNAKSSY